MIFYIIFYKPFILWSFGINLMLSFMGFHFILIVLVKLFLICLLWYFINETKGKQKLVFYNNLGISPLKLFSFLFIIDLLLSIPFLFLLKEFI
ncbi:hypothetical protein A8C32_06870 [Flavivirga aquatica]|uniref:Uncharacterized protein n=1 Tax=Flavivirga aquatica TaxID=1849968 RepID=A0A1E5SIG9_9FLAO|nr:hypothetical protein A8C32_06870 [Flavivirga aquatica]